MTPYVGYRSNVRCFRNFWWNAAGTPRGDQAPPAIAIEMAIPIPDLPDAMALVLSLESQNGAVDSYFFPIRAVWDCAPPRSGIVGEFRAGRAIGWVSMVSATITLFAYFWRVSVGPSRQRWQRLVFCKSPTFSPQSGFTECAIGRSGAEQSNASVTADDVILKAFRELEPGVHPELEVGRYLTEDAGFRNVPKLLGSIEYVCPSSKRRTALCVLQGLIRNGKDGWQYFTERLKKTQQ